MAQADTAKFATAYAQDGFAQLAGTLDEISSTLKRIARAIEATSAAG
jgi:hypothetical protein